MVPDPDTGCVGMEYFCFKGDELWNMDDEDLVALATRELEQLGLVEPGQVRRGYAVRVPLAYPMYDESYAEQVETIREWLDPIQGLVQVGRNGLHRYNNSDHSMLSAMRAVDNVLGRGEPRHLGGQRRVGVPRGRDRRRRRARLQEGPADPGLRGRAAGHGRSRLRLSSPSPAAGGIPPAARSAG